MPSTCENEVPSEDPQFLALPLSLAHFHSAREVKGGRKKRKTGVLRASPTQRLLANRKAAALPEPLEVCLPGAWHPRLLSTRDSRKERIVCSVWVLPNSLALKEVQEIRVGEGTVASLAAHRHSHSSVDTELRDIVYPFWSVNIISQTDATNPS